MRTTNRGQRQKTANRKEHTTRQGGHKKDKRKERARRRTSKEKPNIEPNKKGNEIHEAITVTIQTKEGHYEATLTAETDEKCPLQKIRGKLGLTRFTKSHNPRW